jgi:hypothetical protein
MPYRDDQAALEARRQELQGELEGLANTERDLAQAKAARETAAAELARVEAKLRRMKGAKLPLLEAIQIASPCTASWADMKGDARVRFCGSCDKHVYDLSAMARGEAEALLREKEGNVCVRLYKRADGTVLTSDCPVGVRKRRFRKIALAAAGATAGAFAAAFSLYRSAAPTCTRAQGTPVAGDTFAVMGSAAPVPAPPGPPTSTATSTATATPKAAPSVAPATRPADRARASGHLMGGPVATQN